MVGVTKQRKSLQKMITKNISTQNHNETTEISRTHIEGGGLGKLTGHIEGAER